MGQLLPIESFVWISELLFLNSTNFGSVLTHNGQYIRDLSEVSQEVIMKNKWEYNANYLLFSAPSQQPPPNYEPLSPTSLRLYWDGPDYPNGVILRYYVYRDEERVGEVDPSDGRC